MRLLYPPARSRTRILLTQLVLLLCAVTRAHAFCGFYVASGDAKLFNHASRVVLVRDDDRTVMTLANDFKGEATEFAMVVPVPAVLDRGQIHVGDRAVIDRLDAYSAPRLVEYFDPNPCGGSTWGSTKAFYRGGGGASAPAAPAREAAKVLGVTIEASYMVGEYDILILSAKQSDGLEQWLVENGYRIPEGASRALDVYLKQGMKFFVAKVNLVEKARLGFSDLRPLQIAFESPKFMLPIRLGMVNADGPQELLVYAMTPDGRVEPTNYRSVKLPTDLDVPLYVKDDFGRFYQAVFGRQTEKEKMGVVFTEYAWDMAWCDPCAAQPLSNAELRKLGVFWLDGRDEGRPRVFLTRMHARYDRPSFPEDLVFQATGDRTNFQGRYVLRHPFTGDLSCSRGETYKDELNVRRTKEADNLALLTGWDLDEIRARMRETGEGDATRPPTWWEKLWGREEDRR